ncbi:MAG: hypothetical protein R3C53_19360 [Pirellulaceae bacterium]
MRKPLVDEARQPESVPVAVATPKLPPPKIEAVLLGTAVMEVPADSIAWIRVASNPALQIRERTTVELIPGNPSVKAIEERRVVFEIQGQEVSIEMAHSDKRD